MSSATKPQGGLVGKLAGLKQDAWQDDLCIDPDLDELADELEPFKDELVALKAKLRHEVIWDAATISAMAIKQQGECSENCPACQLHRILYGPEAP